MRELATKERNKGSSRMEKSLAREKATHEAEIDGLRETNPCPEISKLKKKKTGGKVWGGKEGTSTFTRPLAKPVTSAFRNKAARKKKTVQGDWFGGKNGTEENVSGRRAKRIGGV